MDALPPADPSPEPNPFEPPRVPGGRPRRVAYRAFSIVGSIFGVVAVIVAGIIAFVGTCFPIGLVAFGRGENGGPGSVALFYSAWVVGFAAALLAGFGTFRLIFRSRWRRLPADEELPP